MTAEFFVPLELLACGGGAIRGKVRLQKLAFLIQQKDKTIDYDFEPAPLGPLSYQLGNIMLQLQQLGLADEAPESTKSGNTVFCYSLTDRGKSLLKVVRVDGGIPVPLQGAVHQIYAKYGSMTYLDLLNFVHKEYPAYHLQGISLGDFGGPH